MSNFDVGIEGIKIVQDLSEEIFVLKDQKKEIESRIAEVESEVQSILSNFYNLSEASDRLNESPQSLLRSIRSGRYKGVNYGGRWYVESGQIRDESEIRRRLERGI
tara:strand:- start:4544 stop:4861 length:318 start_codon:yes stop_codon:yes gene_type:complete